MRTRGLETQLHNFYGASESSCTIYTVPQEGIDLQIFPSKARSASRSLTVFEFLYLKGLERHLVAGRSHSPPSM